VLVGAGFGGSVGWIGTMATIAGQSGVSFKVWTVWSVLLIAISGTALVGGALLWWFGSRRPERPQVIVYPPAGSNWTVSTDGTVTGSSSATQAPVTTTSTSPEAQPPQSRPVIAGGALGYGLLGYSPLGGAGGYFHLRPPQIGPYAEQEEPEADT